MGHKNVKKVTKIMHFNSTSFYYIVQAYMIHISKAPIVALSWTL